MADKSDINYLERAINELESREKILRNKAHELSEDSSDKRELMQQLNAIDALKGEFFESMDLLEGAGAEEKEKLKEKAERSADELKKAVNQAISRHTVFEPVD